MSDSADVLLFDWDDISSRITGIVYGDRHDVENILNLFGKKIGDKYVLLSSSHHDWSEDSLLPLCHALDRMFGTDDMYSAILDMEYEYIGGYESGKCEGDNDLIINTMICEQCKRGEINNV